jgi:hypothetical protein
VATVKSGTPLESESQIAFFPSWKFQLEEMAMKWLL